MSIQVQFRRGTTTDHSTFTGAAGEVTVDTTKNTVVVHNNSTVGGVPLAKEDLSNYSGQLPVGKGGTGVATAADALNVFLPSQGGNNGKYLSTNGTTSSWQDVPVALTASNIQNSIYQHISVTGTNTLSSTLTPTLTAYTAGQTFRFVVANTNTGATTINLDSLGAKAVTKEGAVALAAGDLLAGAVVQITYDGTQFQLSSGVGGGGADASGAIYENAQTISANYTMTTNYNGHSVGPISIATGVTVTIPTGSRWVIS